MSTAFKICMPRIHSTTMDIESITHIASSTTEFAEEIKVDTITELTTDAGVSIETVLLKDGNITLPAMSGSLGDYVLYSGTPGYISGGAITEPGGAGVVDIAETKCYLRQTDSDTGIFVEYTVAATTLTMLNHTENIVYIDYAALYIVWKKILGCFLPTMISKTNKNQLSQKKKLRNQ